MKKFLAGLFLLTVLSGCDTVFALDRDYEKMIREHKKQKIVRMKEISIIEHNAIKAIVGEGEDQGYVGMLCLAEGIRNRGTLKGVYGYRAVVVKGDKFYRKSTKGLREIPSFVVDNARKAWLESKDTDNVHDATHWENIKAFGVPYWASSMTKTHEYKDHAFYRK